jgi:hypothetical protein
MVICRRFQRHFHRRVVELYKNIKKKKCSEKVDLLGHESRAKKETYPNTIGGSCFITIEELYILPSNQMISMELQLIIDNCIETIYISSQKTSSIKKCCLLCYEICRAASLFDVVQFTDFRRRNVYCIIYMWYIYIAAIGLSRSM